MSKYSTGDVREHDDEPLLGLPECLPQGERLLWQGSPNTWQMARRVLHFNKILAWFSVVAIWRLIAVWQQNGSWSFDILATPLLALCIALVVVYLVAWLYARSTVYTLTTRRVTMRFGLAVQITMNVPFSKILSADVNDFSNDVGNIAFKVEDGARVSHLILWPNVRPWHWFTPQPMLCCVDGLERVSQLLSDAVAGGVSIPVSKADAAAAYHAEVQGA